MEERNEPIRVLQVLTGMGSGGAEAFLMNMYRNIDRSKVQFDFLLRSHENIYENEIEALGGKVYYTASFPRHYFKNKEQVRTIFNEHNYSAVHVHANTLLYMTALAEAKRAGIRCRIMHSHSTFAKYKATILIHKHNQRQIDKLATCELACSEAAAEWMFGKQCTVIKNAIDLEKFKFDEVERQSLRTEMGISQNAFVLGHVGRFLPVKNHKLILEVFCKIQKTKKDAVLVLVGTGELFGKIQEYTYKLGISANVRFLGVRKDINRILNVFDSFIFPSLYEGLGISLIEAQANGLEIFCSERIPQETIVSKSVHIIGLAQGAEYWAEAILMGNHMRNNNIGILRDAGFDIQEEAKKLQEIYLSGTEAKNE